MQNAKLKKLKEILKDMGNILIAYSGGVDSTLLLKVAKDTIGERVVGAINKAIIFPESEYKEAIKAAKSMGVELITVEIEALGNERFRRNAPDRCYWCKKALYTRLKGLAKDRDLSFVADGENLDDEEASRPGQVAARELRIRHPLKEAGIGKQEVRDLSGRLHLPTHNKPSFSCLATRIPPHTEITRKRLKMIEEAEEVLRALGFPDIRVRHHGDLARIELRGKEKIKLEDREVEKKMTEKLKSIGFRYATINLENQRPQ